MHLKRVALAAGLVLAAHAAYAQGFSDNEFSYRYEPNAKEPGTNNGGDTPKNVVNLTHVDGGGLISNFVTIDVLQSTSADPAAGSTSTGATEVYGVYRGNLDNQKAFGGTLSFGPVKDVTLEVGVDANTKNTAFAPEKKQITVGPNFHFDTLGFFNFAALLSHEWNYNGIVGKSVDFDTSAQFEFDYMRPLTFLPIPLRFEGFTNITLPKGRDGFGNQTVTEVLSHDQLTLDVGDMVFHKAHVVDAFVGWEYWLNKFGNNHSTTVGSLASGPYFGVGVHF